MPSAWEDLVKAGVAVLCEVEPEDGAHTKPNEHIQVYETTEITLTAL